MAETKRRAQGEDSIYYDRSRDRWTGTTTRSVRLARMILIQATRNAMVNDLVVRNVADLATVPTGKLGRPSKSLNLDQTLAVLDAAKGERLWPYVAVSMLGGIRTEEARALRWSEVDLEAGTVAVPEIAVDALLGS